MGHLVERILDDLERARAAKGCEELFVEPTGGRVVVGESPEIVLFGVKQRFGERPEDRCDVPPCVGAIPWSASQRLIVSR